MKVKELIKLLNEVDENMEVYCNSKTGVFDYGIVNSASAKSITIVDGDGFIGEEPGEKLVLIIDEQ